MIPSPWEFALLAAGAFRLLRLAAWDTFPPVARARGWLLGEREANLPDSPPWYTRELLADLFHCPFCLGFWIALATYGAWLGAPTVTLAVCVPLALSTAVGLAAKNLDP